MPNKSAVRTPDSGPLGPWVPTAAGCQQDPSGTSGGGNWRVIGVQKQTGKLMGKTIFFGKNKSNSKYAACHALPLDTLSTGLTSNMSGKKCANESCSDAACERSMLPVSSAPLNAALCLSCNVSVLRGNDSDDADWGRKGSVSLFFNW